MKCIGSRFFILLIMLLPLASIGAQELIKKDQNVILILDPSGSMWVP